MTSLTNLFYYEITLLYKPFNHDTTYPSTAMSVLTYFMLMTQLHNTTHNVYYITASQKVRHKGIPPTFLLFLSIYIHPTPEN